MIYSMYLVVLLDGVRSANRIHFEQKMWKKSTKNCVKKKIIPDLVHLTRVVLGVADHEFHTPRTPEEAENRPYGGPPGKDLMVPILIFKASIRDGGLA